MPERKSKAHADRWRARSRAEGARPAVPGAARGLQCRPRAAPGAVGASLAALPVARYRLRMPEVARNLLTLAAIRGLFWMHFVASALVPFFRDWGGLGYAQILLLNAWFMGWSFLLEVPTGAIADRFGRKTSVALGAAVSCLAALLYASAPRYEVFLVAEILFALSYTLVSGADEALAVDSLHALGRGAEVQRALSRLESWKLGGILVGGLGGSVIAAELGLRAPMLAQSIPAALAALLALTLSEPARSARAPRSASYRALLVRGVTALRTRPALRALALDLVAHASLAWLVIWTYQPRLEDAGVPLAAFGTVHAALCVGQIGWIAAAPRVEARLFGAGARARARTLTLSSVATGIAFLALARAEGAPAVIGAVLAAGIFGLVRPVLFGAALHAHIGAEERATVVSTISMLRMLGVALVNPLAGLVADRSLPLLLALLGVAILGLAAATRPRARWLEAPASRET
jgi:hypothetical protein